MCVKYNKSFKHVVTASESSVSWKHIIFCSRLFSTKMAGEDWGKVVPSGRVEAANCRQRIIPVLMKRSCFIRLQVIKVWDLETGRSVFEFSQAHGDHAVTCMSFDSTERR